MKSIAVTFEKNVYEDLVTDLYKNGMLFFCV